MCDHRLSLSSVLARCYCHATPSPRNCLVDGMVQETTSPSKRSSGWPGKNTTCASTSPPSLIGEPMADRIRHAGNGGEVRYPRQPKCTTWTATTKMARLSTSSTAVCGTVAPNATTTDISTLSCTLTELSRRCMKPPSPREMRCSPKGKTSSSSGSASGIAKSRPTTT